MLGVASIAPGAYANPIPLPVPASMPLEEMAITIDRQGKVTFSGDFTFDFIPDGISCPAPFCEVVTAMQFPLPPVNVANVAVYQDGTPLPWSLVTDMYPTVLPEHPFLEMFEWSGPFPVDGAVFTVEYEHNVFRRGFSEPVLVSGSERGADRRDVTLAGRSGQAAGAFGLGDGGEHSEQDGGNPSSCTGCDR